MITTVTRKTEVTDATMRQRINGSLSARNIAITISGSKTEAK